MMHRKDEMWQPLAASTRAVGRIVRDEYYLHMPVGRNMAVVVLLIVPDVGHPDSPAFQGELPLFRSPTAALVPLLLRACLSDAETMFRRLGRAHSTCNVRFEEEVVVATDMPSVNSKRRYTSISDTTSPGAPSIARGSHR